MKSFKISIVAFVALFAGISFVACTDANEYEDVNTSNKSFVNGYTDSLKIDHPETLANTSWVRGNGIKVNAYGEEVQGYVESIEFDEEGTVVVKMSKGSIPSSMSATATWKDDSNTESTPKYDYSYNSETGAIEISITEIINKKPTKNVLFTAIVTNVTNPVMTVSHYTDTPSQTYLVKK